MKLEKKKVEYIEFMTKELVKSLYKISDQLKNEYVYASEDRAKFKRLRVELAKELMDVQKEIY